MNATASPSANAARPLTLLICALGGEGGGVMTEWLSEIALHAGYAAQATSIPGVAQRTGATTYYIEVFPIPVSQLGGRRPVFSLNPVAGALDAIVSSELLETARQVGNGMSSPARTTVITSSARTLTTSERMNLGDGRADSARLADVVKSQSREHHILDMATLARESGTIVSAVMLGAVAGSGVFPFIREDYEHVIRETGRTRDGKVGRAAEASLRGFARAYDAVSAPRAQAAYVNELLEGDDDAAAAPSAGQHAPARTLPPEVARQFPPALHDILSLGHARLVDYQGEAYAGLYVERLARVLAAEQAADPAGAGALATTRETARWLALWMAFDDIVRVADLKSRASRWRRVQGEVKAKDDDLLHIYDHFKPGAPEFAALLPQGLADRVMRWDSRRRTSGKGAWEMPLKVGTHSVFGMVALRTLSNLKWLRVRGSRYATEQALIGQWLDGVETGTRARWQLGHEVAQCGRLIKGYGSTNERGKENLLHVLHHLARGADAQAAAQAVAAARAAALADDAGRALDATLVAHGAPARPVKEQPIRWMKNPRAAKATGATQSA
ncbi:MAG: indolepyruvate oxidoreductase subunit beta family protein [Burkholderiaceae bacterium]|nr:indolepyruvate oxidoreductase subunit beta family protein [Burkholderiaceae bacterium]